MRIDGTYVRMTRDELASDGYTRFGFHRFRQRDLHSNRQSTI